MLYDPIRKKSVADTPEERVRQALLRQMVEVLAFPKGLIAVEKKLLSQRRADIIVFRRQGEGLTPLVVIECKAEDLDEEAIRQVVGYNTLLAAPFLCVAHQGGIQTFWKEGGALRSIGFLPPYTQLLQRVAS
ncbi:MAG TPA: type I restriction enzyme HsdR N-terminal domain-containing protein [Chlamydiales bacterium]|jgi:hypothetical protein